MMAKAYHVQKGEITKVLVPDSAHGTNPASASVAGFQTITIPSDKNGLVNLEELKKTDSYLFEDVKNSVEGTDFKPDNKTVFSPGV